MNKAQVVDLLIEVISGCIKEAGVHGIPSGYLYALLNGKGLSLSNYQAVILGLEHSGVIKNNGHLLTWKGVSVNAK